MTTNPYLSQIGGRLRGERTADVEESTLATLAIAHELGRMNDRAAAGPAEQRDDAVADSDGDRRIAAAARRWRKSYVHRNDPAYTAGYYLSCSELAQVIREVDEEAGR
ncbi:hypothetical protein [Brachybacterium phenoliresistens]|uniref:hypothetical protein n=1 Tax=Brachybacterium phenoliresistens TaxID=396014 RepID=UPI0031E0B0A3